MAVRILLLTTGIVVAAFVIILLRTQSDFQPSKAPPALLESAPESLNKPTEQKEPIVQGKPAAKEASGPDSSTSEVTRKLDVLKEILESQNDNDPRLDSEFRVLSAELKTRIQAIYNNLSLEKLNSRGTLVFLLGRSIGTNEDAEFFNSVLSEQPCKSLDRCQEETASGVVHEEEPQSEVTLAYPQIIATVSLVKSWSAITDPRKREELIGTLQQLTKSSNAALARSARAALQSVNNKQANQ